MMNDIESRLFYSQITYHVIRVQFIREHHLFHNTRPDLRVHPHDPQKILPSNDVDLGTNLREQARS